MEWLILLALFVLVVLAVLAKRGGNADEVLYEKNEPLFSPAERTFYGVLNQAVNDQAVVFGKVRVADVLRPPKGMGRSNWQKAFNRISSKHFDYVICAPDTLSVLAVIELDDKSHSKGKRAERDSFLESACSSAGLALHRFRAAATYSLSEVRDAIFPPREGELKLDLSKFRRQDTNFRTIMTIISVNPAKTVEILQNKRCIDKNDFG